MLRLLALLTLLLSMTSAPAQPQPTAPAGMGADAVTATLQADWAAFDKRTGITNTFMGMANTPEWHLKLSPPLPETWPPRPGMRFTYYAQGEYQTFLMHGPALSLSAPWAAVSVAAGAPPRKQLLRNAPGPAVYTNGSRPLSQEQAQRASRIRQQGEAHIAQLLGWADLPPAQDPAARAIRDYYCQWSLDYRHWVQTYAVPPHAAFFAWLDCPQLPPEANGIMP
jgi:hypothetical protein